MITRDHLKELLSHSDAPCVSIFLPTHRAGPDIQQDSLRLKNLLKHAEAGLCARGVRPPEARKQLAPLARLLEDQDFWRHQDEGLALFVTDKFAATYRVPLSLAESVSIAPRFAIKPLLPLLNEPDRFYVLALSRGAVRLIRCTKTGATEVPLPPQVPRSLEEALWFVDREEQLQFHTGAPQVGPEGTRRTAMYHGHGTGLDDPEDRAIRFFRLLDKRLHPLLRDEPAPLLLAAVESEIPLYRQVNTYPGLLETYLAGNPDNATVDSLYERGMTAVKPFFAQAREHARSRYRELLSTDRVSNRLGDIASAAWQGRVDVLFVATDCEVRGRIDHAMQRIEPDGDDARQSEDLLDAVAGLVLTRNGTVYASPRNEIPEDAPAAAIFRY